VKLLAISHIHKFSGIGVKEKNSLGGKQALRDI
jgi:hypothetical protein